MNRRDQSRVTATLRATFLQHGGVAEAAKRLGCSRQYLYQVLTHGRLTPERALQIERHYGVPRQELLPHLFR